MHCWRHKTPIIYRATTQWFAGMDDVPGSAWQEARDDVARNGARRHRRDGVLPGLGQGAALRHDRQPARLDAVAAAAVGRADAVLHAQGNRRAASRARWSCSSRSRSASRRAASRPGRRSIARELDADDLDQYVKIKDTLDVWFDSGSTHQTVLGGPTAAHRRRLARRTRVPGRSLPRGLRPAPRLVPFVAARVVHAERRAAVQGAAHARLRRRRRRPEDVEVEGQRRRAAEGLEHAGRRDPAPVGGRDRLLGRALRSPTRS